MSELGCTAAEFLPEALQRKHSAVPVFSTPSDLPKAKPTGNEAKNGGALPAQHEPHIKLSIHTVNMVLQTSYLSPSSEGLGIFTNEQITGCFRMAEFTIPWLGPAP